ncbi:hypothetical protein BGX33_007763 [Mortierella sp. NVP41]|nr:hypothetical protein BGX33_007763 [Mortierella sp. NVP41]
MDTISTTNPLDIPELRHRLSLFVTVKDALSCARVSKAWTDDFIAAIWFTVDFDMQPRFVDLAPDIITKHGHLIRIVKNARFESQISILANTSVNRLKELRIDTAAPTMQHVLAYGIVSRNITSLETLDLFASYIPTKKQMSLARYVAVPALAPPSSSKLKTMRIADFCLTSDGLITIFQASPRLSDLRLHRADIVRTLTWSFQHSGITFFSAELKKAFPREPLGPSLLLDFPNLRMLLTWIYKKRFPITTARIKEEHARHCPRFTGYQLSDNNCTIVSQFYTSIATNASTIMFLHKDTSLEMINTILLYQATLKFVMVFYVLRDLDYEAEEMDMDEVEMDEWTCKNLHTFRIRIKGLDTKNKILKAIALWRAGCWRRWQEKATEISALIDEQEDDGCSIEARVARHLLQFEKLWWVWLGYQTWTPI